MLETVMSSYTKGSSQSLSVSTPAGQKCDQHNFQEERHRLCIKLDCT